MNKVTYVGLNKAVIKLNEDNLPIKEFNKIHDFLHVRSLYIKNNLEFLLISIEITSISKPYVEIIKEMIFKNFKINKDNIWISVTHTFSAPHLRESTANFNNLIYKAVSESVKGSLSNVFEAQLEFNQIDVDVNVNRNVETSLGWWLGRNDDAYSNHQLQIVKIKNKSEIVGIIYSYDIQASVMQNSLNDINGRSVSADLVGYVSDQLEKTLSLAIFLPASCGDQRPLFQAFEYKVMDDKLTVEDLKEDGFKLISKQGDLIVKKIKKGLNNRGEFIDIDCLSVFGRKVFLEEKVFDIPTKNLKPSKTFDFSKTGRLVETDIECLVLGNTLFIGLQMELNSSFGKKIMELSPFKNTVIITLVNESMKYLPEDKDFARITYTAMNSNFAIGGCARLLDELRILFDEIKEVKLTS